jgi:hypothetical protein
MKEEKNTAKYVCFFARRDDFEPSEYRSLTVTALPKDARGNAGMAGRRPTPRLRLQTE